MGCWGSAQKVHYQTMEQQVNNLIKNPKLKNSIDPKELTQKLKSIIPFIYCSINQEYLTEAQNQIKKLLEFKPSSQTGTGVLMQSLEKFKSINESIHLYYQQIIERKKQNKTNLDKLCAIVNCVQDNTFGKSQPLNFFAIDKDRIKEPLLMKEEEQKQHLQRLRSRSLELSSYEYRVSTTKIKQAEKELLSNSYENESTSKLKKEIEKLNQLLLQKEGDIRTLKIKFQAQQIQYKKTIQSIYSQKTKVESQFKEFKDSLLINDSYDEEKLSIFNDSRTYQIEVQTHNNRHQLNLNSKVLQEEFYIKKPHKKFSGKTMSDQQNVYQMLLKYFGLSKILPSLNDVQKGAKMRKDIFQLFPQKIVETKLLFSFDFVHPASFNEYIAKQVNLFVMIKLQNDRVIGGFSGQVDDKNLVQNSFLFSLQEEGEPIQLKSKGKCSKINSDPNYLNFGSSELRIKSSSSDLVCNVFGLQSIYILGGKRMGIETFLGDQNRSSKVKGYEIFRLYFEE